MERKATGIKLGMAVLALMLFGWIAAPSAEAQCIGPDGFDFIGECCQIAQPELPDFPAIEQEIKYICWRRCEPRKQRRLCVVIDRPRDHLFPDTGVPAGCAIYDVPVRIETCGAAARNVFSGRLLGTYARTWLEDTDGDGRPETQVWRMLLNGDLTVSDFVIERFGNNPCVPQSFRDYGGRIYWYGYIDYRLNCDDNAWDVRWAVNHECDAYHHNSDSARPAPAGGYNPERSFTIVGPSTFTPSLGIPPIAGGLIQENTRTIEFFGQESPTRCFRDDPLRDGFVEPFDEFCACTDGSRQYVRTNYAGFTLCGNNFGLGEGKELVQKKLGFFVDAAGNPVETLLLWQGDLRFLEVCLEKDTNEYFEGIATLKTVPTFTFDFGALVPLARQFHDIASCNDDFGGRLKGAPRYSTRIISGNTP